MYKDGHHVLFERRLWEANQPGKELRSKPGLLVPMWRDYHEALHKEVDFVPPFPYKMGQAVLSLYRDNPDNHRQSIDNFLFATEEVIQRPKTSHLERTLGYLILDAVEMQVPFMREGGIDFFGKV